MRLTIIPENKEIKKKTTGIMSKEPTEEAFTDQRWIDFSINKNRTCSFETYKYIQVNGFMIGLKKISLVPFERY